MNRINYKEASPKVLQAMLAVEKAVHSLPTLDGRLKDLVYLRVSQMNGCAYCIDMHAKDLRAAGETNERIDCLSVWREAPFYSPKEKAAFAWAEAVTKLGPVDDATYRNALESLGDAGLAELNFAVAAINMWNRFGVPFQLEPGKYEAKKA